MTPKGYAPANSFESPRFSGVRTFMRLPLVRDLEGVDVAFLGVPFDTGASFRVGARFGPEAVRSASHLLRPFNAGAGVDIFEHVSAVDAGDVSVVPGFIADSFTRIEADLRPVYAAGVVPLVMGGDHSIALPELRAAAATHGPLALVHFDSHSDTWDSYFGHPLNHGTPFRRAIEEGLIAPEKSIQLGIRGPLYAASDLDDARALGLTVLTTDDMREMGLREVIAQAQARVGATRAFVSFDIDFLDPAFAPGTGTPEVGGFTTWEAQQLLRGLAGIDVVGADMVEVLPAHDPAAITAFAGAAVLFELLTLVAIRRRDS
ncbi:MAG: agmatinase [Actinobacteria bacterium]|nr:agmatinase [Actinomycetota bacterium]